MVSAFNKGIGAYCSDSQGKSYLRVGGTSSAVLVSINMGLTMSTNLQEVFKVRQSFYGE